MALREVSVAVLALTIATSAAGTPAEAVESTSPSYLAVIDAGSSGSRLTLYSDDPTSLIPGEELRTRTKTRGLSSFASTPAEAGPAAITPLLEELDAYLAERGIDKADVPVSLLATAGMRTVRRADRAVAQAILDSTGASITASGHPLSDNRILPAVQEATLAWLDANVLSGTLDRKRGGIGIVEIGGASAQVAFRSPTKKGEAVELVRVAGQVIPVVAASYLGLGSNDARSLMQTQNDAGSFCFPNNTGEAAPDTYVSTSSRPVNASTARFSWTRCAAAYEKTIEAAGAVRTAAAPLPPSTLRTLPGFDSASFVGLGGSLGTFAALGIADAANEKTALRGATSSVCTGTDAWMKVLSLFAGRSSTFADTLCSSGTYSYELLFGAAGAGVNPRRFTADTSGFSRLPTWASGYAITVLDE